MPNTAPKHIMVRCVHRGAVLWLVFMVLIGILLLNFLLASGRGTTHWNSAVFSIDMLPPSPPAPLSVPAPPHQHVYYLKTHKTGSTTVFSILGEYCRTHNLVPLMPTKQHFNEAPPLSETDMLLSHTIGKYDMVFNHHILTPKIFDYLHHDTYRITTLREPFNNFVSAFNYYRTAFRVGYLMQIPGDDPIMEFLVHHEKYNLRGYNSFTNNRQSMDLGFNVSYGFDNIKYIQQFIEETEDRFNFILITEHFDESLVMLKRRLRWTTEDILYRVKNEAEQVNESLDYNSTRQSLLRKYHAKFSTADIMLYNHFLVKFVQEMSQETSLQSEVKEFKDILLTVENYCEGVFNRSENLMVSEGQWNNHFVVTPFKCKCLGLSHKQITDYLKTRQNALFKNR